MMLHIVVAEVIDECRYLPLKLYIERFDHIQPAPIGLPCHNPVDIGVVVHTDANRGEWIDIRIRFASGERRGLPSRGWRKPKQWRVRWRDCRRANR